MWTAIVNLWKLCMNLKTTALSVVQTMLHYKMDQSTLPHRTFLWHGFWTFHHQLLSVCPVAFGQYSRLLGHNTEPCRLEISWPGLASATVVFQEVEEQPFLNLSPDVLLRPAEPCSVWLGEWGMAVKSLSVRRCWAWQFRPNCLWHRLLRTTTLWL